jgi:hypothetical protein
LIADIVCRGLPTVKSTVARTATLEKPADREIGA